MFESLLAGHLLHPAETQSGAQSYSQLHSVNFKLKLFLYGCQHVNFRGAGSKLAVSGTVASYLQKLDSRSSQWVLD